MCVIALCGLLKGRRPLGSSCLTYRWHPLQLIKSPFFRSGVDYLGPLNFSEGRRNQKALGLLFTCMASQAIYVELVTPLTLDNFFACLYLIYRPAWTGQYDLFR